jgi:hypothetical protein
MDAMTLLEGQACNEMNQGKTSFYVMSLASPKFCAIISGNGKEFQKGLVAAG